MVGTGSSTATTAITGRAPSPTAVASRSDSGARPGSAPSTATVQNAIPTYRTVTTARAPAAARGMSRPGEWYLADRDATISHPTNAHTSMAAALPTPATPCGAKGVRLSARAYGSDSTITTTITVASTPAITSWVRADTSMPNQFTTVTATRMSAVTSRAVPRPRSSASAT